MERGSPARFVEHASTIASYYGFRSLREVNPELYRKEVGRAPVIFSSASVMCAQCVTPKNIEPVLAFWATPSLSHPPFDVPERETGEFSLQVTGTGQSLGEIVILKTLAAILVDWGVPIARVRINALGDRDSRERFSRELTAFLRRRFTEVSSELSDEERTRTLRDPLGAYASQSPIVRAILLDAPRAMHFLSERSRVHFKELLEHLEAIGIPYELDDTLGGDVREPRVLFRIDLGNTDSIILASMGGRYDDFVGRLSGRREQGVVGASIFFRKRGASRSCFNFHRGSLPKIYFVQLGTHAKLRGLSVIDILRHADIPIAQSFDANRLSLQLQTAGSLGVPYVLIMGEREALDGTIIVRSMRNSSQHIVELTSLPKYLRTLRV